jgi:hypothetical protein
VIKRTVQRRQQNGQRAADELVRGLHGRQRATGRLAEARLVRSGQSWGEGMPGLGDARRRL